MVNNAWDALASDYPTEITKGFSVGESRGLSNLEGITNLFVDRYETIKDIFITQAGFHPSGTIKEIKREFHIINSDKRKYQLIGMVSEMKRTKSGGKMITLEDSTSQLRVFIRKEDPASDSLLIDDVIGIRGSFENEGKWIWADEVQYADILINNINKGGEDIDPFSIAFISDLHMGSKYFLEETWDKIMDWFKEDELSKNIKYLVLSGDCVDGVGIYPGQEKNLVINNAFDQYDYCARKLDELPDHITPIILPGNHDIVRPAEPQPVLEPEIQQAFNSAIHLGNPARVNLNGLDILSYHGKSMDDLVPQLDDVTYENSIQGMKHMLKKRHLAPMWGERNALSPEETDQLVIRDIPDIFVTGHTHSHGVSWYRGVPCIVSSTVQGQTDFMQMLGYSSMKGYLTLYNAQNRESKVLQFHPNDS